MSLPAEERNAARKHALDAYTAANTRLHDLRLEHLDASRSILENSGRPRVDVSTTGWLTTPAPSRWEHEIDRFSKLIPADLEFPHVDVELMPENDAKGKPTRAHYNEKAKTCFIDPKSGDGVVVHELGHHLEASNPAIHQAAMAFLNERRQKDKHYKMEKLTKLRPQCAYRDDEVAFKDKFIDPYIGKDYRGTATEVISMGLQYMYSDPVKLATEDPDYFRFLYRTLRGA